MYHIDKRSLVQNLHNQTLHKCWVRLNNCLSSLCLHQGYKVYFGYSAPNYIKLDSRALMAIYIRVYSYFMGNRSLNISRLTGVAVDIYRSLIQYWLTISLQVTENIPLQTILLSDLHTRHIHCFSYDINDLNIILYMVVCSHTSLLYLGVLNICTEYCSSSNKTCMHKALVTPMSVCHCGFMLCRHDTFIPQILKLIRRIIDFQMCNFSPTFRRR